MTDNSKATRGGKRPNAGRKKGDPTVTLSYRVKSDKAKDLDIKIKELINEPPR